MATTRILLVEDDHALAHVLSEDLRQSGYDVACVANGNLVLGQIEEFRPDLVLLDVVLPGKDGFELCGLIRRKTQTPVIMVTARDSKADTLKGLYNGADDYVTKPFDFDEFVARIRAVLRRSRPSVARLRLGSLTLDFVRMEVIGGHRQIHLTAREFNILLYLGERTGSVVQRSELLREVWGYSQEPRTRAVDFAIKRIREKIEPNPHLPRYIQSVRGDGYRLIADQASFNASESD